MDHDEDPLASVPDITMQIPGLTNFKMTAHGLRQLLGKRKVRGKPLVTITCIGCGRATMSNCRWIEEGWIESVPQIPKA